ncbi:hypothetical protein BH11PAT2_BH11PAT2_06840 [soil metagenome]
MLMATEIQTLAKCKTFEDFRLLIDDSADDKDNTALAVLAFSGALNLASSLEESMNLLWTSESLNYKLQKRAFENTMGFITDSDSRNEFEARFRPGWLGWLFSHRELVIMVCDKYHNLQVQQQAPA